jgi:hypothetical protein
MKRTLVLVPVLALVAACGGSNSSPVTPSQSTAATRVISLSGNLTFGNVQVGASSDAPLVIQNTGTDPLTVTAVTGPSGYTYSWTKGTVPPNGSQTTNVRFSPTDAQSYSGTVTVAADHTSGINTMIVSGKGTPVTTTPSPAPSPSCTYTLSIGSTIDGYPNGGSFPVNVTTAGGCSWTASTNTSWIHLPSSIVGTGTGSVTFTVDAITGTGTRSGTVTIAGTTVTFNQTAPPPAPAPTPTPSPAPSPTPTPSPSPTPCPVTLSNAGFSGIGSDAGGGGINVGAAAGCSWTAVSNVAWMSIIGSRFGPGPGQTWTGPGELGFSFTANTTGASRTGTITIGNQTLTIQQNGYSCDVANVSISPTRADFGAAGGSGAITVTYTAGCAWDWLPIINVDWVTAESPGIKYGSTTVTFTVAPNNTGYSRNLFLALPSHTTTFEIYQAGK